MVPRSAWLELRELISLIKGRLPSRAQILDRSSIYRGDEEYIRLFRAVESEEFETEEELVASVFGKPIDGSYRVLRSKLKGLALNTLFVLDLESAKFSEYAVAKHTAARQAFQVRMLGLLGARRTARGIAKEALQLTRKYELWEDQLLLLSFLRDDALHSGDLKSHQPLAEEIIKTLRAIELEERARALSGEAFLPFVKSISPKPHLAPKIAEFCDQVSVWAEEIDTYQIRLTQLRLKELYGEVSLNSEVGLEAAKSGLQLVRSRPEFGNKARETEFIGMQVACLVNIGRSRDAADLVLLEKAALLDARLPSSYAWKEQYLYALLHSGQIQEADAFYREETSRAAFLLLGDHVRERWSVFGLWLDLATDRLDGEKLNTLQRLLEVAPSYTKDKAGIQISLFLLHIVVSLRRCDRAEAGRSLSAIRHYQSRYLKGAQASEERAFMRLLDIAIAADVSEKALEEICRLRVQLSEADPRRWIAAQALPYLVVWDSFVSETFLAEAAVVI